MTCVFCAERTNLFPTPRAKRTIARSNISTLSLVRWNICLVYLVGGYFGVSLNAIEKISSTGLRGPRRSSFHQLNRTVESNNLCPVANVIYYIILCYIGRLIIINHWIGHFREDVKDNRYTRDVSRYWSWGIFSSAETIIVRNRSIM